MRALPVAAIAAAWLAACTFDPRGVTTSADDDTPSDDDNGDDDQDPAPDARPEDPTPDGPPPVDPCDPGDGDEDADGIGDTCDGCPQIPDPEQPDGDGDGVDDGCDPDPEVGGDTIAFFDGFHGSTRAPAWKVGAGGDTWTVSGDALVQGSTDRQIKVLYLSGFTPGDVIVEAAVTFTDVPASTGPMDNVRSAGVVTGLDEDAVQGRIAVVGDLIRSEFAAFAATEAMSAHAEESGVNYEYFPGALEESRYLVVGISGSDEHAVIAVDPDGTMATASAGAPMVPGTIGLRTRSVAARYAYVIAYGHTDEN